METRIPVRLFALPEFANFPARGDREASSAWVTTMLVGSDAVKMYSDTDPTEGLNGSRERLAGGQMVDVIAQLRLYPRRPSGFGVSLESFSELPK